jgi:acyl-CoA reductase-like NAD-dependent aldehyde dehydrogenase
MELKLWEESFQPLNKVAPSWKQLSDEDRASVLKHWQRTVNKMPDDLRAAMAAILEKSIKA